MSGRLTTHVLDTAQGRPASDLAISLWIMDTGGREKRLLKSVRTNADGRTEGPLLADDDLVVGIYELVFDVGAYFAAHGLAGADPPFLSEVPVRFGISDPRAHYHVPLLTSPWSYSTYRGS